MGLLGAFATGMVKGFTQNIKEEKARRLADEQNLKTLEGAVIQASLSGDDYIAQNGDAVMKAIKAARGELDEKEAIDLFGTETPRVNIDETKLLGKLVTNTDKTGEDTFSMTDLGKMIGSLPELNFTGEEAKKYIAQSVEKGPQYYFQFLTKLNEAYVANPKLVQSLLNGDEAQSFKPFFVNTIIREAKKHMNLLPENQKILGNEMIAGVRDLPGGNWFNLYADYTNLEVINRKLKKISENEKVRNNFLVNPSFSLTENGKAPQDIIITRSSEQIGLSAIGTSEYEKEQKILEILAKTSGFVGTPYFDPVKSYVFEISKRYNNQDEFSKNMKAIIDLGKILDDNKDLGGSLSFTKLNEQQKLAMGKYLNELEIDGELAFSGIFGRANFVKNMIIDERFQQNINTSKFGSRAVQFVDLKIPQNKDAFEHLTGVKLIEFGVKDNALKKAQLILNQLDDSAAQLQISSGGIVEGVYTKLTSIKGAFEQAGELIKSLEKDPDDPNRPQMNQERRDAFQRKIQEELEGRNLKSEIGKKIVFELMLAAELARAEDPAGRLSDADFERNLQKVRGVAGGDLFMQAGGREALRTDLNRLEVEHKYINGIRDALGDRLNLKQEDLDYLKAIKIVKSADDIYQRKLGVQASVPQKQVVDLNSITESINNNENRFDKYNAQTFFPGVNQQTLRQLQDIDIYYDQDTGITYFTKKDKKDVYEVSTTNLNEIQNPQPQSTFSLQAFLQ